MEMIPLSEATGTVVPFPADRVRDAEEAKMEQMVEGVPDDLLLTLAQNSLGVFRRRDGFAAEDPGIQHKNRNCVFVAICCLIRLLDEEPTEISGKVVLG